MTFNLKKMIIMCLLLLIYIIVKKCYCIKNNINEGYVDNPISNDSEVIPSFHIKLTCTSETPFDKDKQNYTPFIQSALKNIKLINPIFQMTECFAEPLLNCVYPIDIKVSYINETQIAIMFNTKLRSLTFDDGKPQIEEAMSQFKDKQFSVYSRDPILFNIDSIEVSNYYDLPLQNYTIVLPCTSQTPFNNDERQYTTFSGRIMKSIKSNKFLAPINKVTECLNNNSGINDVSIECLYVYKLDISYISETQINIIIKTKRRALTFDDGKEQIEYALRVLQNKQFTVGSPMDVIFKINSINIESNRGRREVLEESYDILPISTKNDIIDIVPGPAMAARPAASVPGPAMAARPAASVPGPAITNNTLRQERKSKRKQERLKLIEERKSKRKQERLKLREERKSKRKQERLKRIEERKSKRKQEILKLREERKSKRKQERLKLREERKSKRKQERIRKRKERKVRETKI